MKSMCSCFLAVLGEGQGEKKRKNMVLRPSERRGKRRRLIARCGRVDNKIGWIVSFDRRVRGKKKDRGS